MRAVVAVMLIGCGSPSATSPAASSAAPPPPVTTEAPPPAPPPAPVVVAPPPPTATIESVITAGALTSAAASELLGPLGPQLAACLATTEATTTELLVSMPDGIHPEVRNAWRGGVAMNPIPLCLAPIFPLLPDSRWNEQSSTVYFVVKATPPGMTAPAAPAPPEGRAEIEAMFCRLDRLSGADKLEVEKRMKVMTEWARNHIRHPGPYELAGNIGQQSPSDISIYTKQSIKAHGIKKCPMHGW